MVLSQVEIENFGAFRARQAVDLHPGINVVVGANNAGKSTLLDALRGKLQFKPHISLTTKPYSTTPLDKPTKASYSFKLHGVAGLDLFVRAGVGTLPLPEYQSIWKNRERADAIAKSPSQVEWRVEWGVKYDSSGQVTREPVASVYCPLWPSDAEGVSPYHIVSPSPGVYQLEGGSKGMLPSKSRLIDELHNQIFFLGAERITFATGHVTAPGVTLEPNCHNLPGLINALLSSNPAQGKRMVDYVRRVLPEIVDVTAPPIDGNRVRIQVHFNEDSDRRDLAFWLEDCGAGTAQVIAIAYILAVFRQPRTIIVDELQTFLHPGALTALLALIRTVGRGHQWILTSHSPLLLSVAQPDRVFLLMRNSNPADPMTVIQQIDWQETSHIRDVLVATGTRLSDIFGHDFVVWVEGQCEEDLFPDIANTLIGMQGSRGRFVPVFATGDFDARKDSTRSRAVRLYQELAAARGLVPPAVGFLFDAELRSEGEQNTLAKLAPGRIQFLSRRTLENYLLDADAISELLVSHGNPSWSSEKVQEVLEKIKESGRFLPAGAKQGDWLSSVDAPKVLEEVFRQAFGETITFRKTRDSVALGRWLLARKPDKMQPIAAAIKSLLG